jgi:membrane associated rhomboid family serine protease
LARALSSCCGDGRDTSLTRIAVFSVTFIPGIMASAAQCRITGAAWHQVPAGGASGAPAGRAG